MPPGRLTRRSRKESAPGSRGADVPRWRVAFDPPELLDAGLGQQLAASSFVRLADEPGFDPQSPDLPRLGADEAGQVAVRDGRTAFCIDVHNSRPQLLYVTLLQCGASGKVYWLGKETVSGRGRHVFWCDSSPGLTFLPGVVGGREVCLDRVVAIGTSSEADLKFMASNLSFAEIIAGAKARDFRRSGPVERWTSDHLVVRTELK